MCGCAGGNRSAAKVAQREIPETQRQVQAASHRRTDTGNPVNRETTSNVVRANEVNRERYHTQHFGGR